MYVREIKGWPVRCLAVVACVCAASPVTSAHHAHQAFYDWCQTISFEGRITRVEWKAPHSIVDVQADGGTTYHVEMTSAQQLARQYNGTPPAALAIGARIAVIAHPARDGAAIRASFPEVTDTPVPNTVDPAQIRRVDGTFTWGPSPAETPANCGPK
jgi:hypothetical protein